MTRPKPIPAPCGVVQVVHVQWDKASRGGVGARSRASVPEAFEVDPGSLLDAGGMLCIDRSQWGGRNDFARPFESSSRRTTLAEGFSCGCVQVSAVSDGLEVRYRYDTREGGAPNRSSDVDQPFRRTLSVRAGEWARIRSNGRFRCIDSGTWWYEQVVMNVAWFAGRHHGRVFLDSPPARELDLREELR